MPFIRYVLDLQSEIVDEINRLIAKGRYRSVQDFLSAAATNQLHLEQHEVVQEVIVASENQSAETTTVVSQPGKFPYQMLAPDFGSLHTVSPPEPSQVATELYGLWNRFFPVKLTTRVLANILRGNGEEVPLDSAQERAAEVARKLGREIFHKERDLGRKRGDMIATALPWKREEFKATNRFKSHFVGYLSKNGIEGAPATLRFVNIRKSDGRAVIGLTAAGAKFAGLTNPLIDQDDYSASLSQLERDFLTDHIRVELPAEAESMKFVLRAVKDGATSPTTLNKKLSELKPKLQNTELVTLRSGLLGRMYELNLMQRARQGLTVSYDITSEGRRFIEVV